MTGILRYSNSEAPPRSEAWTHVFLDCSDETSLSLTPILPCLIPQHPSNAALDDIGEEFDGEGGTDKNPSIISTLAFFSLGRSDFVPFIIDYSNPIFLHLNYTGK